MSDNPQPGLHPDPDLLNAFIEGALAEHERLACLAHLAECADCREVVYLAQEPITPEPVSVPAVAETVSFWKRWLTPIPALRAAAVTGIAVFSVWLYLHEKPAGRAPELVAMAPPSAMASAPYGAAEQLRASSPEVSKTMPEATVHTASRAAQKALAQPEALSKPTVTGADIPLRATVPPASPPAAPAASPLSSAPPPAPATGVQASPQNATVEFAAKDALPGAQTGIAGTVTDPAGGAIAGATVRLRPVTSPSGSDVASDSKGRFNVAGIEPGQYELQVVKPGFQQLTKQVYVQPDQVTRVDSTLSIGAVMESVEVTAQSPRLSTASSSLAAAKSLPQPLPNKLPAAATVVNGKVMLSTDSVGNLFLSQNAGKKWKAVKPVWHGKVVSLESLASSGPAFQLKTDGGAVWLSREGNRWYAAPAQK
jgi:hypothetical protein